MLATALAKFLAMARTERQHYIAIIKNYHQIQYYNVQIYTASHMLYIY